MAKLPGNACLAAPVIWEVAAELWGMPFRSLRHNRPDIRDLSGARYPLVRSDCVIAWRGDASA